jgi:hypothetical protein
MINEQDHDLIDRNPEKAISIRHLQTHLHPFIKRKMRPQSQTRHNREEPPIVTP